MRKTNTSKSQDTTQIILETMQAIDILHDIYEKENEALNRSSGREFMGFQVEKEIPLNLYMGRMEALMIRMDDAKRVDPLLKQKLQAKQEKIAALCEENLKGIKKMQRGTERLSNKIRFCAQESARQKGRYSYGETGRVTSASIDPPLSIGLSEEA